MKKQEYRQAVDKHEPELDYSSPFIWSVIGFMSGFLMAIALSNF